MLIEKIDRNKMGVNSYVLKPDNSNNVIVVDPGLNFNNIVHYCNNNDLKVSTIVLTHGHYDHILDTMKIKEMYNCDIYAHQDEKAILNRADKNYSSATGENTEFDADYYVRDGDTISVDDIKFKVMHTPGHTRGGICLYDGKILISGDTLFRGTMGRTDLFSGSEDEMMNSLKKLKGLPDETEVYPGHGSKTTIAYEKEKNPYLRMA